MTSITAFGLEKSRLTVLLMISLLVVGAFLYQSFPRRESPEITIRTSMVTVYFPGMDTERMEQLIALPVEREIRGIPEVKDIHSLVSTGQLSIKVELKDSIRHLEPVWQELRDKMEEVQRTLPSGSVGPYVNTNFGDVSVATIAVTADGFGYRDLELVGKDLQRKLYAVPGVSKTKLYGVQEERIWLELDMQRMAAIGLQLRPLIADMQAQNVIHPAGSIRAAGSSLQLEASGDFGSIEDIRAMLTKLEDNNTFVQLADLVDVKRGTVSPREQPVFYNGQPAVVVSVQMASNFNIEQLGRDITGLVRREERLLPIGYELNFASYQPAYVKKAVDKALSNVGQTSVIVLLIMMVFLGLRSSLVISSIVIFSVMGTLIGMRLLGLSLEQISIAAIIISLGLLVDNGIVIVEDIQKRIAEGADREDAARETGQQFSAPLLISTLTTIFAFVPFFILEGSEGEYAFSLGAVVAVTLIFSWLTAVYFLPYLAIRLIKGSDPTKTNAEAPFFLSKPYAIALGKVMKFSPWIVVGCYLAVACSGVVLSMVRSEMFPLSDRNQVLIYVDMPKGTHIAETTKTVEDISQWLMNEQVNPEVQNHISYVGSGGPRFYLALNPLDPAPEIAFILVDTDDFSGTKVLAGRLSQYLFAQHPEARFKIKRLSMGANESGIVDVEITGDDLGQLMTIAEEVEALFRVAPGITQNENDWGNVVMKALIDIDQDRARRAGVSSESLSQVLAAFFDGISVSEYREDDQSIPIVLRAGESSRSSLDDIFNIVFNANGEWVTLEQVANIRAQAELSQIRRKNQIRTITISAKSSTLTAGELVEFVQSGLDNIALPDGFGLTVGGEVADNADINTKLGYGFPGAVFLMLLAIIYQFNSARKALIVFMTIPLVVIGVPYGLILSGQPLSFFGSLGLISLAGIIINNAIVLIDQITLEAKTNTVEEAISLAAQKRIRPILLTSATTVIGLMPLYLFGDALWSPLAIVMMSGLAVSSVLTLFFVPACYRLMYRP